MNKTPSKESKHCIKIALDNFLITINTLEIFKPICFCIIPNLRQKSADDFKKFLYKHAIVQKEKNGILEYKLKDDSDHEIRKQHKKIDEMTACLKIMPQQIILSMISQYDFFIGQILKCIYSLKSEILSSSDTNILFSDLSEFSTIESIKDYIIEKKIDSFLRDSHFKQIECLENILGIKLREGLDILPTFIELTERRNLFAHTNGIVSSQYIDICKKHNYNINGIKKGMPLYVNRQYLDSAYDCLVEMAIKLSHVIWQKLDPATIEDSSKHIELITYELLTQNKYNVVIKILSFFTQLQFQKKFAETTYKILLINLAQAYKWSGQDKTCIITLKSVDWSASDNIFKLAVAVLSDKIPEACSIMKKLVHNEISKDEYRAWPLFQMAREHPKFQSTFYEIFKEKLISRKKVKIKIKEK